MTKFSVLYEYDEYDYEIRTDEDDNEYDVEVCNTIEDYIYIEAANKSDAFDKAYDELYDLEGLSVLSAKIIKDED